MGFILTTSTFTSPVWAQVRSFDVPVQEAVRAIPEFARQAGVGIIAPAGSLKNVRTPAVKGDLELHSALVILLQGTGLVVASEKAGVITLRRAVDSSPVSVVRPGATALSRTAMSSSCPSAQLPTLPD
jgi:iron complex outermembrane receptor protein